MKVVRWFWIVVGAIATVLALIFGTLQFIGLIAEGEYSEVRSYSVTDVKVVDVSNDDGRVRIVGSDRADVLVTQRVSESLRKPSRKAELIDGRLELSSRCGGPWGKFCGTSYEIEVPRAMAVRVSVDDGNIDVRHLDGDVELSADNGNVRTSDLTGRLVLESRNGSVRGEQIASVDVEAKTSNGNVDLSFLKPVEDVRSSSKNGNVRLTLPETSDTYDVDISTAHGRREAEVRTDPSSQRHVTARTVNGNVSISYAAP